MNITKRLFAYPVLSEEKDDYKTAIFQVDVQNSMQGTNTLRLSFDIKMDCHELEEMIADGRAEYIFHTECSRTAYRQIKKTISNHDEVDIPISRVNGNLEIVAFIVTKKSIENFKCADWNDDFADFSFSIKQGSIIGYQNLPGLSITKNFEEFSNANSIFTIYKKYNDSQHFEVNLDREKIRIGLPAEDYDIYAQYGNRVELQPIVHSMIILPAMVYLFEELKQEDEQEGGMEKYQNREWFIALEKAYQKRGINFREEVKETEKTSLELAQDAMEYPVKAALLKIPQLLVTEEEE